PVRPARATPGGDVGADALLAAAPTSVLGTGRSQTVAGSLAVAIRATVARRISNTVSMPSTISTSFQVTTSPAGTSRISGTLWARATGRAPRATELSAEMSLPYTQKPPSPSSTSPAFRSFLAVATTSA